MTFKKFDNIFQYSNEKIFYRPSMIPTSFNTEFSEEDVEKLFLLRTSLTNAVLKRIDNTDRDIACLLSGGLDSSLITALVQKNSNKKFPHGVLECRFRRY